eukprot:3993719-Prymnesium_polylepis.1
MEVSSLDAMTRHACVLVWSALSPPYHVFCVGVLRVPTVRRTADVLRAQRERRTDTALNTAPKNAFLRCRRTR